MSAEGETVIRFGVCNIGSADYAGDPNFHGELYLFDETQTLLTRRTVESLGPVVAQETALPGQLTANLLPGEVSPDLLHEYLGLRRGGLLCRRAGWGALSQDSTTTRPLSDLTVIDTD